jgi:hypothetical protein
MLNENKNASKNARGNASKNARGNASKMPGEMPPKKQQKCEAETWAEF